MNTILGAVQVLALSLVHSLWELALLSLLAALSLAALRSAGPMWRHAVGMGWLLAMLAAPALTFVTCWPGPLAAPGGAAAVPLPFAALGRGPAGAARPWVDWAFVGLAVLWLLGVVWMAVRHAVGWQLVQRLRQQAYAELPPVWQQRVEALRATMGISRRVRVRLMAGVVAPFTTHLLQPLVWLPARLLAQLPRPQIEALLAHELAHIRRLDWCWNGLQCVAETLLFYHPGLWWLNRRIRLEREHACDDLAVAACGDPVVLAEALASLQPQRAPAFRLGLAAQGGPLLGRITRLLSGAPPRPGWRVPAALLLLLCCGGLVAMAVEPPQHLLVNLMVEGSSHGALRPGDQRELTASYLAAPQRHYRIAMDAQGQVTETYTEGGQARPIDAAVRQWLQTMAAMSEPPAQPPATEVPEVPEVPEAPAGPPAPPEPPAPSHSAELQAVMAMIAGDSRVLALTGAPATVEPGSFHGQVHTWGAFDFHLWGIDDPVGGKAAFSVTLNGPRGRAQVAYAGKTVAGRWQTTSMDVVPARR